MARAKKRPQRDIYARRRAGLCRALRRQKLDALLVSGISNVRYLSGFSGDDSVLVVRRDGGGVLITDGRYTTQAQEEVRGLDLHIRRKGIIVAAAGVIRDLDIHRLGIEAERMHVSDFDQICSATEGAVELETTRGLVEKERETKGREEIAAIERAIIAAEAAMAETLAKVRVGISERQLAAELDAAMRRHGADGSAFETIVAAGERAALPHARPSDRKVGAGECLLFDWGARVGLYNCDLTRVVFVSRIPAPWKRVYGAVLEAQTRAIRSIRAGVSAARADAAARGCLKERRLANRFTHGLGHGVGLDVHEAPTLRSDGMHTLEPGMVVTVEPGVYLPGQGGVRIEDMVLVEAQGSRVLTSVPKALDEIVLAG